MTEGDATLNRLLSVLRCPSCSTTASLQYGGGEAFCECGRRFDIRDSILRYSDAKALSRVPEVGVRDAQARGYLQHAKFPIQMFRVRQWLDSLPAHILEIPALELGSGPGPYTGMLLERGYRVLAIDFSEASLAINRDANSHNAKGAALFAIGDLNLVRLARNSTGLLLMCDVLQHIGGLEERTIFLSKVFEALAPNGCFYLSFFNFNVKNYISGDRHGTFAGGKIRYERLRYKEVLGALPPGLCVDSITPTNVFHAVRPDRLVCALPGAQYLARMIAISGRKIAG